MTALIQEEADAAIAHLDNGIAKAEPDVSEEDAMPIIRERVVVGEHDDGSPIYKRIQASSKDELHRRIAETLIEYDRLPGIRQTQEETALPKAKTLFRTYCENYCETVKKNSLRGASYRNYLSRLNNHVYPAFGEKYIEDITTNDVIAFLNERANLSKSYLEQIMVALKSILQAAVEDQIIPINPANSKRVKNPTKKRKEKFALSVDQLNTIQAELPHLKTQQRLLLALVMYTGMRRGEAAALRWEDIDFERGKIHVCRTVSGQGKQTVIEEPKTEAGKRDIPLCDSLRDILLPLKGRGYVITGDKICKESRTKWLYKQIGEKIDLYGATLHTFRHTYATMLYYTGCDVKTLQRILGHSDIQTTMNTYVHWCEKNVAQAGEAVAAAFKRSMNK